MSLTPYQKEARHPLRIAIIAVSSAVAILFILYMATWVAEGLGYTDRGRAWQAVHRLSDASIAFHAQKGRWPATLSELEQPQLLQHDGVPFTYDPATHHIALPSMFPPTPIERLFGGSGEGGYGIDLDAVTDPKTNRPR